MSALDGDWQRQTDLLVTQYASIEDCAADSAERGADVAWVGLASFILQGELAFGRVLGLACLLFPQRLLVQHTYHIGNIVPSDRFNLTPSQLFAFGFRRVLQYKYADALFCVYEYKLSDYKHAPDWLKSRFWANPERFNNMNLNNPGASLELH